MQVLLDVCYSSRIRSSEPVSDQVFGDFESFSSLQSILYRSLNSPPVHMSANYQRGNILQIHFRTHPSLLVWNHVQVPSMTFLLVTRAQQLTMHSGA